jgi:LPXTG-site transpeptidase (sortase) family protein
MTTVLRWLTRIALTIAALCVAFAAFTLAEQSYYRAAARTFSSSVQAHRTSLATPSLSPSASAAAETAVADAVPNASPMLADAPGLLGELVVPHLRIATAVVEGDDAAALRRGAGHVRGTAMPGDGGNVVVAGHRDTVFRRLGELQRGDRLRLTTARGVFDYRVSRTLLVRPGDTWVLRRSAAALTLITCYPFNWIGSAPERWIVQAEPMATDAASDGAER